jgi:murein L,D-transpeptidase YcbB/YkuD
MKRALLFALLLLAPIFVVTQEAIPPHGVTIRSIAISGGLTDLRWPNFSDHRASVDNFYKPSYQSAWIRKSAPSPQALAVIDVLRHADEEGLNAEDYDGPRWPERLKSLQGDHSPDVDAGFDVALTVCVMRYVSDVRVGRVNPQHLNFGLDVGPKKLNLAQFLRDRIVSGDDIKSALVAIEPPFAGYQRTRATLLHYMQLAKDDDGQPLPVPDKMIVSGDAYAGLPRLTRLLVMFGDLPASATSAVDASVYKEPLVRALKNFQLRHGLPHDGRLDKDTIAELNQPLSFRVEQLRLTLERWRWLPLSYAQPPIVVNLPEFFLRAYDAKGKLGLAMNVNVGEAYEHETPVFEQAMSYIVFRPYWDVPASIQRNEIAPDIEADRDYIKENNFEVISDDGKLVTSGTVSDSVLQQIRAGKLRVRQKPGPSNALGLVKFIFPNVFSVYLHDTPQEKEMFLGTRRDLSHGCIHVQEPDQLAAWVLRDKPEWTLERIQHAMHDGPDNTRVNLTKPIPVLILYGTAVVEDDGEVFFYHDIYGHDATLEKALAKGYPYPR